MGLGKNLWGLYQSGQKWAVGPLWTVYGQNGLWGFYGMDKIGVPDIIFHHFNNGVRSPLKQNKQTRREGRS